MTTGVTSRIERPSDQAHLQRLAFTSRQGCEGQWVKLRRPANFPTRLRFLHPQTGNQDNQGQQTETLSYW